MVILHDRSERRHGPVTLAIADTDHEALAPQSIQQFVAGQCALWLGMPQRCEHVRRSTAQRRQHVRRYQAARPKRDLAAVEHNVDAMRLRQRESGGGSHCGYS